MDRILLADLAIGLPADMLHKVDTASMLHSLEVRVPLLSRRRRQLRGLAADRVQDCRARSASVSSAMRSRTCCPSRS